MATERQRRSCGERRVMASRVGTTSLESKWSRTESPLWTSPVPGLAAWREGRRDEAVGLAVSWSSALIGAILGWGVFWGWVMVGYAFLIHVASVASLARRRGFPRWNFTVAVAWSSVILGGAIYVPALCVAWTVFHPFQAEDGQRYVVDLREFDPNALEPGEWLWVESPSREMESVAAPDSSDPGTIRSPDRPGTTTRKSPFQGTPPFRTGDFDVARLIAGPGRRVSWDGVALRVDGGPGQPDPPDDLTDRWDLVVPDDHWAVVGVRPPGMVGRSPRDANMDSKTSSTSPSHATSRSHSARRPQVRLVPQRHVKGRVWGRLSPFWRGRNG